MGGPQLTRMMRRPKQADFEDDAAYQAATHEYNKILHAKNKDKNIAKAKQCGHSVNYTKSVARPSYFEGGAPLQRRDPEPKQGYLELLDMSGRDSDQDYMGVGLQMVTAWASSEDPNNVEFGNQFRWHEVYLDCDEGELRIYKANDIRFDEALVVIPIIGDWSCLSEVGVESKMGMMDLVTKQRTYRFRGDGTAGDSTSSTFNIRILLRYCSCKLACCACREAQRETHRQKERVGVIACCACREAQRETQRQSESSADASARHTCEHSGELNQWQKALMQNMSPDKSRVESDFSEDPEVQFRIQRAWIEGASRVKVIDWNALDEARLDKISDSRLADDLDRVQEAYGGANGGSPSVSQWLADNSLSAYEQQMVDELGVTEVGDLPYITAEDLTAIGMRGPKQRRFLAVVETM